RPQPVVLLPEFVQLLAQIELLAHDIEEDIVPLLRRPRRAQRGHIQDHDGGSLLTQARRYPHPCQLAPLARSQHTAIFTAPDRLAQVTLRLALRGEPRLVL